MKRLLACFLAMMLMGSMALAEVTGITVIGGEQRNTSYGGEELAPGNPIKVDGNYRIEYLKADALSRADQCKGGKYGYLTTTENKAKLQYFLDFGYGTHAPMYVRLKFTNFTMEETSLLERVDAQVVYDDLYEFYPAVKLQHNPDQTTSAGETDWASTVGVEVEPLVAVDFAFLVSVPLVVLETNKPLVMNVTIDNDVYTINLRDSLVIY